MTNSKDSLPSARIKAVDNIADSKYSKAVKDELDRLHKRLVSAEAQLKIMSQFEGVKITELPIIIHGKTKTWIWDGFSLFQESPTQEAPKPEWCEHITWLPMIGMDSGFHWWHSLQGRTEGTYSASDWKFCPDCGKERPL